MSSTGSGSPYVLRSGRRRLEEGVNVFGYAFAEHGVGEGMRQVVAVASELGVPLSRVPFAAPGTRQAAPDPGALGEAPYDVNLVCVNADTIEAFVRQLGSAALHGRYNVALWCWEVESFPPWMAAAARFFDEIWACSRYAARAIAAAVPVPVFAWPWPLTAASPRETDRGPSPSPGTCRFLFCFDYQSVFERKNPLGLVEAFRLAFPTGGGARLLIKSVNGASYPEQEARLLAAAASHAGVEVADGYLDRAEQRSLVAACDAYVSLHRAEGLGITLAEALALGKPVIATAYSGNLDFMDSDGSYLVPYRLSPIPPGCGPYPAGTLWADPDLHAAAGALREVAAAPGEAWRRADRGRSRLAAIAGPPERTAFLEGRLRAIRATLQRRPPALPPFTTTRWAGDGPRDGAGEAFRSFQAARDLLDEAVPDAPAETAGGRVHGSIDLLRESADGGVSVRGWVPDVIEGRPPRAVVLYLDGRRLPCRVAFEKHDAGPLPATRDGRWAWRCNLPSGLIAPEGGLLAAFADLGDRRLSAAGSVRFRGVC